MAAATQEMGIDPPAAGGAAPPESNLQESQYEVQVQLSDLHQDTDHPLASVASFDELGLPEKVRQGLAEMGFLKPSKVQETALPLLLANPPRNMIAQSQSGTGKTAAFVTTLLSRVDFTKPKQPQALVLAPSRELARQIQGVIQHIGKPIEELEVVAAIKGAFVEKQPIQASVVVGTPGTVLDVCKTRQLDVSQIKILVIDEADNMLDLQGMGDQCKRIRNVLPKTTQILLFSATFPDRVMKYADQFAPRANVIRLKANELTVKGIAQMYMDCPSTADKYAILCKLYGLMNIGSSIIFVKTRESATQIQQSMTNDGHKVSVLHGAYEGSERDALLDDFRSGRSKVLITTNVLARGIDVSTVSMVINYDIPMKGPGDGHPDTETYLHRIGRTGRFGRVGVSITFVADKKSFMAMKQIADELEIELVQLSPDDWDETEQKVQRVIKSSRAQANYVPTAAA